MTSESKGSDQDLRHQAEQVALGRAVPSTEALLAMSPEDARQVLHELKVHQIELAMQNEELRRSQVELDAARARYFDLYDLAPVGYCTITEAGLILEANFTAANLLGVTRSALFKCSLSQFIVKSDQDTYYLCRNRLFQTTARQSCELRMVKDDGTPFWASLTATVAKDAEGVSVQRVMLSDITDRKLLEHSLQETNAKLEDAWSVADKANLAKSEFLSSMSHELRSPLNAILGFAQLMEHGPPQPTSTQKDSIEQILKAGWYLLELINEVLDLASVESGKVAISLEPTSLSEVLLDCQAMIEPQTVNCGISVSFPEFEGPCFVDADRTRLKQVLVNLLSNAVKYNKSGGTVEVTFRVSSTNRVRISVQDSGEGLPAEKVAQLFEPFNRLGRTSLVEGTGIGLTVSKRLVELMGGDIGVESTVGEGSVFWFELNQVVAPQPATSAVGPLEQKAAVSPATALSTVLYVEDNRANMQLVEQLIARRPDIRLLGAIDGARGIVLARTQQPDVIVMDINLPDITGIQALKILREDRATAHIPVLALSANVMPNDVERGMASGFLCYLTKPIKINQFMDAIDRALAVARTKKPIADRIR